MSDLRQYCTFQVAGLYLGIPVQRVQEVMRALEMTAVPLAAPAVRGLINLRGQIVTAIDLRVLLGIEPRADESSAMHVVIRTEDGALSLMVDAIDDVIEIDPRQRGTVPDSLDARVRALLAGVYTLPERLLLSLDADQIADVPAASTL